MGIVDHGGSMRTRVGRVVGHVGAAMCIGRVRGINPRNGACVDRVIGHAGEIVRADHAIERLRLLIHEILRVNP